MIRRIENNIQGNLLYFAQKYLNQIPRIPSQFQKGERIYVQTHPGITTIGEILSWERQEYRKRMYQHSGEVLYCLLYDIETDSGLVKRYESELMANNIKTPNLHQMTNFLLGVYDGKNGLAQMEIDALPIEPLEDMPFLDIETLKRQGIGKKPSAFKDFIDGLDLGE